MSRMMTGTRRRLFPVRPLPVQTTSSRPSRTRRVPASSPHQSAQTRVRPRRSRKGCPKSIREYPRSTTSLGPNRSHLITEQLCRRLIFSTQQGRTALLPTRQLHQAPRLRRSSLSHILNTRRLRVGSELKRRKCCPAGTFTRSTRSSCWRGRGAMRLAGGSTTR